MVKNNLKFLRRAAWLAAPFIFFGCYPSYAVNQPIAQNQKATQETVELLHKLTQYEIDGSFLISQCIDNVKNQALKDKLLTIKRECEDNIRQLSALVETHGGATPKYSKDFKGYFMNGYAAMRGAFTDEGALKALDTNLNLILKVFESALNSSLPTDVKEAVTKIYKSKKKALQSIES